VLRGRGIWGKQGGYRPYKNSEERIPVLVITIESEGVGDAEKDGRRGRKKRGGVRGRRDK